MLKRMAIDWTNLYQKYKGKWLVLKADEKTVVVSGKAASEVFQLALKKGYTKPILTYVPQKLLTLVGRSV